MPNPTSLAMAEEWGEFVEGDPNLEGGADRLKPYFYLGGPMTGFPSFNFPAFDAAAAVLRGKGYNLVNPAELDSEIQRREAYSSTNGEHGKLPHVKTYRECLRRDVDIILDNNCVGIILLPGWQMSNGARMETYNAAGVGVPLFEYSELDGEVILTQVDRLDALRVAGVIEA